MMQTLPVGYDADVAGLWCRRVGLTGGYRGGSTHDSHGGSTHDSHVS